MGNVVPLTDAPIPTREDLQRMLPQFTGRILQRPPAVSALKVGGRRAYDLVRAGQPVELAARPVHIDHLSIESYEYPRLEMEVACGSGTYIRALGRDLAQSLGTDAIMSALTRTAIGPFTVQDASLPSDLDAERLPHVVLPPIAALPDLPQVILAPHQQQQLAHGQALPLAGHSDAEVVAVDPQGRLLAILVPRGHGMYGPTCNFVRA